MLFGLGTPHPQQRPRLAAATSHLLLLSIPQSVKRCADSVTERGCDDEGVGRRGLADGEVRWQLVCGWFGGGGTAGDCDGLFLTH